MFPLLLQVYQLAQTRLSDCEWTKKGAMSLDVIEIE